MARRRHHPGRSCGCGTATVRPAPSAVGRPSTAKVENRIRNLKNTGLSRLPFSAWTANLVWFELVLLAALLLAALQVFIGPDHDLSVAEPRRLRHVKEARAGQGRRRVKTDQMDLAAMASLLIHGGGQPPRRRTDAVAVQAIWVAHRGRQVAARTALSNQVQGLVDQAFPTLTDCYQSLLSARSARIIIANMCDPDRIRRLGRTLLGRILR